MRKMAEETASPRRPAKDELNTYQRMTEAANFPASPRFTSVAIEGLRAAKMRTGTRATTTRMNSAVAVATG